MGLRKLFHMHMIPCWITCFVFILATGCYQRGTKNEVVLEVTPAEVPRGEKVSLILHSQRNLGEGEPSIIVDPGNDAAIDRGTRVNDTTYEIIVHFAHDAPLGDRVVTLETDDIAAKGFFRVIESIPRKTVFSCSPARIRAGRTTEVTITGKDSQYQHGLSQLSFGEQTSAEVLDFKVVDQTTATATLSVPSGETSGAKQLVIETGSETSTGIIIVDAAEAAQTSITVEPDKFRTGDKAQVSVIGQNTHFSSSTRIRFAIGFGLALSELHILSETKLSFAMEVDQAAHVGTNQLIVESPAADILETVTAEVVIEASPTLRVIPEKGFQGQTNLELLLLVENMELRADAVISVPQDSGIVVKQFSLVSADTISVIVDILRDANVGKVEITATSHDDAAKGTFYVLNAETDTDTDTGTDLNTDTDSSETDSQVPGRECNDFQLSPSVLSAGQFNKNIHITGPNTDWTEETTLEIPKQNDDFFVRRYTVATNTDIDLVVDVGLFTQPGEWEIEVSTSGKSLCGIIKILSQSIKNLPTVPEEQLPKMLEMTGKIDVPSGKEYEYYRLEPRPNDALVFHAVSEDRSSLDVVLRLIDSYGRQSLLYLNDETSSGIDSRFTYFFADDGPYYLGVGAWGQYGRGSYRFYTYRLSHGRSIVESNSDNNSLVTPESIAANEPFVLYGSLDSKDDVDIYRIEIDEPRAIDIFARQLGAWQGVFANTQLTVYDEELNEIAYSNRWYRLLGGDDPFVLLSTPGRYYLEVEAEEGSSGFYGINLRPVVVINEIDNRQESANPFVELLGPQNYDLSNYEICTYGSDGTPVDPDEMCVSLLGQRTNSAGYFTISHTSVVSEALNLPAGSGAVVLRDASTVIDQAQYGSVDSGTFAEGLPAEVGETRTIGRGAGVDTNNNEFDFIYMAKPTPGEQNDRFYQSAVPLFMEPKG